MRTIAFFNSQGGTGKTSLVFHLAWMYAELGLNVIAADLDPQSDLTRLFLDDETLERRWTDSDHEHTIYGAFQSLLEGTGDVAAPYVEHIAPGLGLILGDLALSAAEHELSGRWLDCLERDPQAFRVSSGLSRILMAAGEEVGADLVLVDAGQSLGALDRAVLVAARDVVIPLAPDFDSLQGLRNLGPTLRRWRGEWDERLERRPDSIAAPTLPDGDMRPTGYVVLQQPIRLDRPVGAHDRRMARVPREYRESVLDEHADVETAMEADPHRFATLKHYRSLMTLAQEAHRPMFALKAADGAIGGHAAAVQDCYRDFRALALKVADRSGIAMPGSPMISKR